MTKSTTNTHKLAKFPGPKLSEEDKMHCEKAVSPTKVSNIIKAFEKRNKCPGIDSLSIEF